jgi:integrase
MSKKRQWVGRIYLGRDENGKQQFDWVGRYATRRERDNAVAKRRVELQQQQNAVFPACDEYVDRYLAEYERTHKHSSHDTQADRLKRFRDDFAGQPLDVTRAEAKDWVNGQGRWQSKGPVPSSAVQPVVTLYNHAIDEDDLPLARNPFRKLGQRGKGRAEDPPPTEQEFQALLDACAALKEYAPRMRAFLLFAAFTLMRPSELFALEWTDIDFDAMRVEKARRLYRGRLDEPKTGPKTIALTPPARDAILGQPRTSPYVFTSKTGKRLSSTNMHGYWSLVLARADLDFDLYHATKHYGVHYMWTKLGMSRRAIAAQAGWSVRSVDKLLAVYGHADVGALDEVDAAFTQAEVVRLRKVEG